ncbi:MAG: hypothetical protein QY322_04560 [bacterium]|nr:MAG: hypothetical protein QY322_04560 [bacterium]
MADKKVDTADTLRSTSGKGSFVKATKHEGGDTRGSWEDKIDARMEKSGYIAGLIAKKFADEGIITINEDGKTFHIGGEYGGEVYKIKMLPLVWAALKKKK